MGIKGFKKALAMGSFALASIGPMSLNNAQPQTNRTDAVQLFREIASSRVINETGNPTFSQLFNSQLQIMAQTEVGASILRDLPSDVNFAIRERPEYAEEAGYWDGQNCVIYDDVLLSATASPATLIGHEARHAIQGYKYDKDYVQMPTEQQIIHNKMMEIETRLQDVLMKEELFQKNAVGTRDYEFATDDWLDYRRLKASIQKENPTLPASKIDRMARTQFVVDSWQGNYQRKIYDQRDDGRTFKAWLSSYNSRALLGANKRCLLTRPVPDLTVDESKVGRHHEIMQEYIARMGIDVAPDFFDTLEQDKSLRVIRDPKVLAGLQKHFDKEVKLVVMPRDDFVPTGGIMVGKDNSTFIFIPETGKQIEQEIQTTNLGVRAKQAER